MEEIKIELSETKGRVVYFNDKKELAESTFSIAGIDKIIVDHTDVDESLRGTGTGAKLIKYIVNWSRENNRKVLPLCPFAAAQFKRNKEWQDVL